MNETTDIKEYKEEIEIDFLGNTEPFNVEFDIIIDSWEEPDFAQGEWKNQTFSHYDIKINSIIYVNEDGRESDMTNIKVIKNMILNRIERKYL